MLRFGHGYSSILHLPSVFLNPLLVPDRNAYQQFNVLAKDPLLI